MKKYPITTLLLFFLLSLNVLCEPLYVKISQIPCLYEASPDDEENRKELIESGLCLSGAVPLPSTETSQILIEIDEYPHSDYRMLNSVDDLLETIRAHLDETSPPCISITGKNLLNVQQTIRANFPQCLFPTKDSC